MWKAMLTGVRFWIPLMALVAGLVLLLILT
jgi:hypothetical protein